MGSELKGVNVEDAIMYYTNQSQLDGHHGQLPGQQPILLCPGGHPGHVLYPAEYGHSHMFFKIILFLNTFNFIQT